MLRVIDDRDVAKEAARVNLSAFLRGQCRIVSPDRTWSANQVKDAIARSRETLPERRTQRSRIQSGPERER
jgi:hypothetical protein